MNIYRDTKLDHKVSLKQGLKKSRYQTTSGKKIKSKIATRLKRIRTEELLDEALEETFPASDSVAKY
ncbi:hypothetical protein [Legionella micdadei]|uniref:Transposase n=1 Tax=Legionella micdadei TaxID=451 RepID=A0A098GGT2_LEGMI|nr:hypothetical protein [Legionella micdadei]ARG97716.1 hypothetical protein B6N58_08600 [Legionella micdadei]ARG99971.1 hypothetical protein B6V88_05820 [Legionella micdadei]KTD28416.1 hypothetical protein Lmic_1527 [Legionella micdadei]NSL18812.1 hypothetical protein [Legionella micdadei]CEG60696.1 protein of unknown function [Legionella micdadei]